MALFRCGTHPEFVGLFRTQGLLTHCPGGRVSGAPFHDFRSNFKFRVTLRAGFARLRALMAKLSAAQIRIRLASVPEWNKRGSALTRTYSFKDFPLAIEFVNAVARQAEISRHHPAIDIRWNKVTLALTSHDASGLTEKDFALAGAFDRI